MVEGGITMQRIMSGDEEEMLVDFAVWLDRNQLLVTEDDVDRHGRTPAQIVQEYVTGEDLR